MNISKKFFFSLPIPHISQHAGPDDEIDDEDVPDHDDYGEESGP